MNVNIENKTPDTGEYLIESDIFQRKPVRFKGTDICLYIDFGDTKFPSRLITGRKEIGEYLESKRLELNIESVDDVKAEAENVEDVERILALENEIDMFIKSKLDYIFGYEMSKEVFGAVSSIGVTSKGEYYFDNILNAVLPIIEKEYNIRVNATNERMLKYTDHKGKYHNPYIKR